MAGMTIFNDKVESGLRSKPAGQDGLVIARSIGEPPVEDVLAFIEDNRVLRDFTCEERGQYRILPLCDANGDVPDIGF